MGAEAIRSAFSSYNPDNKEAAYEWADDSGTSKILNPGDLKNLCDLIAADLDRNPRPASGVSFGGMRSSL
jgi:hypothetical protein